MEDSGETIRDADPEPPVNTPRSWLCDQNDTPVVEYIHASDVNKFRVQVGGVTYERFGTNGAGEWLYRRMK